MADQYYSLAGISSSWQDRGEKNDPYHSSLWYLLSQMINL